MNVKWSVDDTKDDALVAIYKGHKLRITADEPVTCRSYYVGHCDSLYVGKAKLKGQLHSMFQNYVNRLEANHE